MKKFLSLLCLIIMSVPLFADMSKTELQQMYLSFFRSQGIPAEIDEDGDIRFEYKGDFSQAMTYYIIVDEYDQQFFAIVKIAGYSLDTAQEKRQGPLAASAACGEARIAKVYINNDGDNIIASAETFLVSPGDFKAVFTKLMRGIQHALSVFVDGME